MRAQSFFLASSLAAALGASAQADDLAPDESPRREALNAIHRLGSDAHQLRFDGENASRAWPIYATLDQTASRARVHIAYSNAISVMPEASTIVVSVNDIPVAQSPIAASSDEAAIDVELPKGLLKPGYNALRIAVAQRHRVDCSLDATYELWTQVDIAASGLTFPGQADPPITSPEDLPAVSPDASGAVQIHAVAPHDATAAELDRLFLGAEMLAIRGGFARPEVDVVDAVADAPGLYVIVGESDRLAKSGFGAFAGAGEGVSFVGPQYPGRSVVAISGVDVGGTERALQSLLPQGWDSARRATVAAERALANAGGFRAAGDSRIALRDLGVDAQDFSGRMTRTGFDIVMPPDFYPADYDKMTLMLEGSYGAGLSVNSQILVRVNEKEAGSLPLRNPRGGALGGTPISVSLSALRPGFNRVLIEAQTPIDADKACAVDTAMSSKVRFSLLDHGELLIPRIARIARLPDLAVTMASGFPYERAEASHLYLATQNRRTLSAAATLLARTAVAARRPMHLLLTTNVADLATGSAILLGTPTTGFRPLAERFGLDVQAMKESWAHSSEDATREDAAAKASGKSAGGGEEFFDQWADASRPVHPELDLAARARATYDRYFNLHASDLAGLRKGDEIFSPPANSGLVLAQARAPGGEGTWSMVLAPDDEALLRGVKALVAPTAWNRVDGRVSALNPHSGAVVTAASNAPYFIVTASLSPANLRLIAAGWLSSDPDIYAGVALIGAMVLGAVTYATVRRHGVRQ